MQTFETFTPGQDLGVVHLPHDADRLAAWDRLFPGGAGSEVLPANYLVAALMRGYLALVDRRPPGNVHAGQTLHWAAPVPRGADLSVSLLCRDKVLKNGRRWIWFSASVAPDSGPACLSGDLRMLWAA